MLTAWFADELSDKRKILQAFWDKKIIAATPDLTAINKFEEMLRNRHFPHDSAYNEKIETLFNDAVAKKIGFEQFFAGLQDLPLVKVISLNGAEKLVQFPPLTRKLSVKIAEEDLDAIRQYMVAKNMSAVIALGNAKKQEITVVASQENNSSDIFGMFSIGKVFTGLLVFKMLEQGIIKEKDLTTPNVQLQQEILRTLPIAVQERLKEVTLHQLMTHTAGIGEYANTYSAEIQRRISTGEMPINSLQELLPLIEKITYPINEFHYSNAGMLILGFALEHLYNQVHAKEAPLDYQSILKKYIIDVIGLTNFFVSMPHDVVGHEVKYNILDKLAPYLIGSPAGAGYCITAGDLAKLGQWLYNEYCQNPKFVDFLEKYGQEFYQSRDKVICHGGGIPSASSDFLVSLQTGIVVAILSNQPDVASDLRIAVEKHLFFDAKMAASITALTEIKQREAKQPTSQDATPILDKNFVP